MDRSQIPLNALRAFEASARHLNFTRAGLELRVSQGAVSHQVALLEQRLGTKLFHRLPRGLALTDQGAALVPVLAESFDRVSAVLSRFVGGQYREALNIGVVGTFAAGWLLERLDDFAISHPDIDLRIMTNNNRPDLAGEALDYAIRFGDGAWHGAEAVPLMPAPLTALCSPNLAQQLSSPADVAHCRLLRSYRADEWPRWFEAAGQTPPLIRGPIFDNSVLMVDAAARGLGIALAPAVMFASQLASERVVQPFPIEIHSGQYWLTSLLSRPKTAAMLTFKKWLLAKICNDDGCASSD